MKHKHSKIHWMTFSGKVRCVDCWSNDELSLCKSCGKMANHRTKDCPIEPPQTDKTTDKIPWQALQFEDTCLECGATFNREWIDNKCKEIANEAYERGA